jgi:hypothetical protein
MLQAAVSACQGKAEGDACIIQAPAANQAPGGNRGPVGNRTGTCKTQEDGLLCVMERGGRQGNFTRA